MALALSLEGLWGSADAAGSGRGQARTPVPPDKCGGGLIRRLTIETGVGSLELPRQSLERFLSSWVPSTWTPVGGL
jgi:hypothetical protein